MSELILELQRMAAKNGHGALAAALALAYAEADRAQDQSEAS